MNKTTFNFSVLIMILSFFIILRILPHPFNFTFIQSLSFYIPYIFGRKFIFLPLVGFVITDLILGFHSTIFFTWISILLISYFGICNIQNIFKRVSLGLCSIFLFYLISNFGVWITNHNPNASGLWDTYYLGLPFLKSSLMANIFFICLIEMIFYKFAKKFKKLKTIS